MNCYLYTYYMAILMYLLHVYIFFIAGNWLNLYIMINCVWRVLKMLIHKTNRLFYIYIIYI